MKSNNIDEMSIRVDFQNSTSNEKINDSDKKNTTSETSRWEHFLQTYQKYYHTEFDWIRYIKDCKLYQKNFDLKKFLNDYGQPAVASFLKFKRQLQQKKRTDSITTNALNYKAETPPREKLEIKNDTVISKTDSDLIDTNNNVTRAITNAVNDQTLIKKMETINLINAIRCRVLINFITPKTKFEKRTFKKWMKLRKKNGLTKREAYERYLMIEPNTFNEKEMTREKLLSLIRQEKEITQQESHWKNNEDKVAGIVTITINKTDYTTSNKTNPKIESPTDSQQAKRLSDEIKEIEL